MQLSKTLKREKTGNVNEYDVQSAYYVGDLLTLTYSQCILNKTMSPQMKLILKPCEPAYVYNEMVV